MKSIDAVKNDGDRQPLTLVAVESEKPEEPLFLVTVVAVRAVLAPKEIEKLQNFAQLVLDHGHDLAFGEIVIHIRAGVPQRIEVTESIVIR